MTGLESPHPMPPGEQADEIADLLHPCSPADLLAHHWARRPLHIGGRADRFESLFDRSRFHRAIRQAHGRGDDQTFAVCRFTQDFDGAWTCSEAIEPEEIDGVIAAGQTVCVRNIAAGDSDLVVFGKRFAARLGLLGNVGFNAYLSADGSGADMHFDRSITCALQIEGRKRWRFGAAPALPWPPGNGRMQADGTPIYAAPWFGHSGWDEIPTAPFEVREVVLEPGDWLILPAGTWHGAKAIGGSLALNMMFSPWPFDLLLQSALRARFGDAVAWRGGVPGGLDEAGRRAIVEDYVEARLGDLRVALDDGSLRESCLDACLNAMD